MKLVYNVNEKPALKQNLVYAFQQVLAIMAATMLVPVLVNAGSGTAYMSQSAALLGAGFGTLVYLFATKWKSPVFLGSSFAFIAPLIGAASFGYAGILFGSMIAGVVYVAIAAVVKAIGSNWIDKYMPPIVIGPTVALIGLSLCSSAVGNMTAGANGYSLVSIAIAVVTFIVTAMASVYGNKTAKMIPFIIGVMAAYILSVVMTLFGMAFNVDALRIIDFSVFNNMELISVPKLIVVGAVNEATIKVGTLINLFMLFAPVAFVTLAEHIADHKNLSSIIENDLTKDPGLHRTVLGDGLGTIVGSIFGGCPNTTYGECVGCVAITGDASVSTVFITALYCIALSFFGPFVAFVNSIPSCIVGGMCIALYGFIAVSGFKMIQGFDLSDNRNLFVVAAIFVTGIGGLTLNFGSIVISPIATALILGIIVNCIINRANA